MEKNDVGHESDEGPGFLGIPVPKTTPRVVGPNAAEDDSDRQKKDADLQAAVKVEDSGVVVGQERFSADGVKDEKVGEGGG